MVQLTESEAQLLIADLLTRTHRTAGLQIALWHLAEELDINTDEVQQTWLTRPCSECGVPITVDVEIDTESQYCSVCNEVFFDNEIS